MANVSFLLGAVGLSLIGSLIVWFRHRQPKGMRASIDQFEERRRALDPDAESGSRRRPGT